jgi:very-short-patch-repair endonuclease
MDDPRDYARNLRKDATEAERRMWTKLRNRRFASFKFRRQVALGPYIVDFVCFERRLVVELDGGQHVARAAYDAQRTEYRTQQGFRVVRFWNHELWQDVDAVEEQTWRMLNEVALARPAEDEQTKRRL